MEKDEKELSALDQAKIRFMFALKEETERKDVRIQLIKWIGTLFAVFLSLGGIVLLVWGILFVLRAILCLLGVL